MEKNKYINVLSKAALAAAFTSAAIATPAIISYAEETVSISDVTPAITASAEETVSISDVIIEQDGNQYKVSKKDYDYAVLFGGLSVEETNLSYILVNESAYSKSDYDYAVLFNGGVQQGLAELVENGTPQTVETIPAKIVDGEVVADEEVEEDFEVIEISAITETSVTVELDATPSTAPTAEDFNVTVGEETIEVTEVDYSEEDLTVTLTVDLSEKTGVLTVNGTEYEEEINFVTPAVEVASVSAIDATTIEVTFDNKEVVEIELDDALVHGENEVTFTYEDQEFTVTVEYVDPAVVAREEAVEAYNEAVVAAEEAEVDVEDLKVKDVEEATTEELVEATEAINAKVQEKVEEDFEVIEISAITETGVTVNFPKLAAAIEGVTVVVKNPAGDTVAVKAQDLAKDATSATFEFVTALDKVTVGTWTVGDKTYEVVEVASVSAIDATTVEVEFAEALEEDFELEGKEINVGEMVATYVEDSYNEEDKTAQFKLAGEDKLVDAQEYTVTSDWTTEETFVARVADEYVAEFVAITTDVPATAKDETKSNINIGAKNQYGEDFDISKAEDVNVKGTVNGMPLIAIELSYEDGVVTVVKALAEDDVLAFTLTNTKDKEVLAENDFTYEVIEAEELVISSIVLKADETSVPSGEEITLTADVRDQFNSPRAGEDLRWVVNGVVQEETDYEFVLDTETPGEYKVQVFSEIDSKIQDEMTVTIGAALLETLTVEELTADELADLDEEFTTYNNETFLIGKISPNEGAILLAENIKFEITTTDEDLTADDITVTAEKVTVGEGDDAKDIIILTAVTSEAGTYRVTPYVGADFADEEAVKATEKTVTTTIDQKVVKIVIDELGDQVLTQGGNVKADVTFTNKHGEIVIPNLEENYEVVTTNQNIAIGELKQVDVKGEDDKEIGKKVELTITGEADEGKATLQIVKGSLESNRIEVETNKASEPTTLTALEKIEVVEVQESLHKVEIKDQYGNVLDTIEGIDLEEVVEDEEDALLLKSVELVYYTEDEDGKITEADADADADGIAVKLKIDTDAKFETGDLVKVEATVGEGEDAKVIGTLEVILKEEAVLAEIVVEPTTIDLGLGGKTTIQVNLVDQYGEAIDAKDEVTMLTASGLNIAESLTEVTDNDNKAITGAYTFTVEGKTTGEYTLELINGAEGEDQVKATIEINVQPAADLIDAVDIVTDDAEIVDGRIDMSFDKENNDFELDLTLEAIGLNGENIIDVDQKDAIWTSSDETKLEVEGGIVKIAENAFDDDDEEVITTVEATILVDYLGYKAEVLVVVTKEEAVIDEETLVIKYGDKEVEDELEVTDLDEKEFNLTITAKDQFDDNYTITNITAQSFNTEVFTVSDESNPVTITAKSDGTATLRLVIDGVERRIAVTVDGVAESKAEVAVNTAADKVDEIKNLAIKEEATEEEKLAAVESRVVGLVNDETIEVTVVESAENDDKYDVTLKKGDATITKKIEVTFITAGVHISNVTLHDYTNDNDELIGKYVIFGFTPERSINTLPKGTKISLFGKDADGNRVGLAIATVTTEGGLDIIREEPRQWGTTTFFLFNPENTTEAIEENWDLTASDAFVNFESNDIVLDYVEVTHEGNENVPAFSESAWFNLED